MKWVKISYNILLINNFTQQPITFSIARIAKKRFPCLTKYEHIFVLKNKYAVIKRSCPVSLYHLTESLVASPKFIPVMLFILYFMHDIYSIVLCTSNLYSVDFVNILLQ